jgi:3-oxoacyl-[acyl-carrier-protein] synthase II
VVERALREAGAAPGETGIVFGSAFGNVDACGAFMHRVFERGPRAASPAEFPNLVPSSPVGHISIYLGAHGPVFATADLGASGPSAFAQAAQLVCAGDAVRVVAGASEPWSGVVDRVLSPLFAEDSAPDGTSAARIDLAAALVVEDQVAAAERGARVLARVVDVVEWRGEGAGATGLLRPPSGGRAEVVVARATDARAVECSAWRDVPRLSAGAALGESDALGVAALAVAAARIGAGRIDEALVVTTARGRGYAFVLAAR